MTHSTNGVRSRTVKDIQEKYQNERTKRLRAEGMSQFTDLYKIDKFKKFAADPWMDDSLLNGQSTTANERRSEFLIIGAGFGGLLYAARLIEAGFDASDILMVDNAGGFGGTWYWNRYPGLMCDIESYIYMPLLEETGYMPSEKYVSGNELREHAERIASKWNLRDKALFHVRINKLLWDDVQKEWVTTASHQKGGVDTSPLTFRSRFVILTTGFTVVPQAPQIKGIERFQGEAFHTARWDYSITGGSPDNQALTRLQGKIVGVIGTGATAIQVVPALAKWCKELYVFQRTPSAVDERGNKPTDKQWWDREIRGKQGWQQARRRNFNAFLSNLDPKPPLDEVADGWTSMTSYSALVGNPGPKTDKERLKYAQDLNLIDLPRQEKIRERVEKIVKDKATAEKLKAWYPGWCKRPCFHDEYLQAFNRENVSLVDTDGRGVELMTEKGVVVGDKEYPLDVLVLSTGYRSAFLYSPPRRVDIELRGRHNISLDDKWTTAVTTLHGVMSHDFPNLFWPGFVQGGGTPNFVYCMDLSAKHVADIMVEARSRVESASTTSPYKYNFVIEATSEAEEEWSEKIASQAAIFGATAGCTPSYINAEGELDREASSDVLKLRARGGMWGAGIADFERVIGEWKTKEGFPGLSVTEAKP